MEERKKERKKKKKKKKKNKPVKMKSRKIFFEMCNTSCIERGKIMRRVRGECRRLNLSLNKSLYIYTARVTQSE